MPTSNPHPSSDPTPRVDHDPTGEGTPTHSTAPTQIRNPTPDLNAGFLPCSEQPGELGQLSHYRLLRQLGAGGMGVVFEAEDTDLRRPVALKVLRGAGADDPGVKARFLREARAAAAIKHDHIVTIHQVGEDRGVPFIVLELLQGTSLEDWLKQNPRPEPTKVAAIGRQVAEGLAAAHARGLVHRDIKPANVWLEAPNDRVKILDFGLARSSLDEVHLTAVGAVVGTPAYMSPEQGCGAAVDHRTDLFSLGTMLYRMCAGEMPFRGDNVMAVLTALAVLEPAPVRSITPAVPAALADLIHRLLSKDPDRRPASAKDVADQLRAVEHDLAASHESPTRDWKERGSSAASKARLAGFPSDGIPPEESATWGSLSDIRSESKISGRSSWLRRRRTLMAGVVGLAAAVGLATWAIVSAGSAKPEKKDDGSVVVMSPKMDKPLDAAKPPKTDVVVPRPEEPLPVPPSEVKEESFEYVIEGEKKTGTRQVLTVDLGGGEKLELVRVPKGSFAMGALDGEKEADGDEKPRHPVTISKDFYLGKFELTQGQYRALTGDNPSFHRGDRLPVENVSWDQAVNYCEALSKKTGRVFALPTEAQWEYACRAGTSTPFHFGSRLNGELANCDGTRPYGMEIQGVVKGRTVDVGTYPANPWGLHDMHGNVWEWCGDRYGPYHSDAVTDPTGPSSGAGRVDRGGGWSDIAGGCRSANRSGFAPTARDNYVGFRLALVPASP